MVSGSIPDGANIVYRQLLPILRICPGLVYGSKNGQRESISDGFGFYPIQLVAIRSERSNEILIF